MPRFLLQNAPQLFRAGGRLVLGLVCLVAFSQCQKTNADPQLPPETTTGANTFGCKIDGKVFLPRDKMGKPGLFVEYPYLGPGRGGGYYLNITAFDWQTASVDGVQLGTDSLLVEQGKTYQFKTSLGNAQALTLLSSRYLKLDQDPGELTVTRFDPTQHIISGRFDFVATDQTTGKQVRVTDGRFDVNF